MGLTEEDGRRFERGRMKCYTDPIIELVAWGCLLMVPIGVILAILSWLLDGPR
jgi:hypothetical protein